MSGYYPPNQHIPPQYYNVNPNAVPNPNIQNVPPMTTAEAHIPHGLPDTPIYHGLPGAFVPYPEPQMQQAYMDQYEDIPGVMGAPPGGNGRMRRRSAPGDHVKHRRTRSGCYTCRNRRVKCDENHPVCERCRKGNRECVYPEPQSASKSGRSGAKLGQKSGQESGSSPEDQQEDLKEPLSAIPDDDEEVETESNTVSNAPSNRDPSDTPSLTHGRSPSPSTEASSTIANSMPRPPLSRSTSNQATKQSATPSRYIPELPNDVKFYLNYFRNQVSFHHYALKRDGGNFLQTAFLDMTIKNEPLLYAVVGFAAYYHTLSKPDGRMSSFLQYYDRSVSLLIESLTKSKKHTLATLMTVLQLASIEEVLGDWVNLMGHQKAAYQILKKLYTPQTITKSELLRKVLLWYVRFDLFVGFQSGAEAVLGQEWYVSIHDFYVHQARENPENITLKYEERFAYSRLVAKDFNDLFARRSKGQLTDEAFMTQLGEIDQRVKGLDKNIDPILFDPSGYITDFSGTPDPDDIVNPYEPNIIWQGQQWTSNYLLLDSWGIMFMYNIQCSLALRRPIDPDVGEKAYRAAQTFEAVTMYPKAPPGAIIEAQACLAIATLFLPKDPKTIQWCRRTFAKIESAGYIYSTTLRNRMLEAWGLEPSDWWLPNDEGCPPIIRSIKNFISDRTQEPKDQTSEDLREMRGIFSSLNISDSPSSDRTSDTPIEGILGSAGVPTNLDETLIYTGGSPDFAWSYEHEKFGGQDPYTTGQFPGQ
ncbi:uncharacterized protein BDR25DRAFT_211783 [Lindgomyces ingoldianus]|uniref:Uncharacterized protein n=1 Tax=Lindgomyces ingoldianus TaxID=673940 RepID=A0ACB6R8J1_9PLEO|nr:uncharacterized protein BDR25DRAFT_211783 [Lindgomyces ingoldianus]KAF2475639.1 hypothetical protein BDR25DRAFT_211783 [Lindgomyces ingoldianus]